MRVAGAVEGGLAPAWARAILVRVAWAGIAAHAAFLPISVAGMQIGLGVALAALTLARLAGQPIWVRTPIAAPVLGLCAAALVSIPVAALAGSPPVDARDLFFWKALATPVVVLLALEAGDPGEDAEAPRRRAVALVLVWTVAALVPASVAWAQYRTGFDLLHALGFRAAPKAARALWAPGRYAAIGFFSWYPRFAHAMTMVAALAGALAALAPLRARTRVLLAAGALTTAFAVVLTMSRSAWAGLAVAAVIVAGLAQRRTARLAVPLALAAAVAAGASFPSLRARLERALSSESNGDRAVVWRVCAAVVADHPLAGVGFGALPGRARAYYDRMAPDYPVRAWCHDAFFSAWAEGGPILTAAVIGWWVLLARAFLRWRREGDALGRAAAAGALAALAALLVNALVHDVFWSSEPVYAVGFLIGAAAVLARPREVAA
jgi:O-antigen ligase